MRDLTPVRVATRGNYSVQNSDSADFVQVPPSTRRPILSSLLITASIQYLGNLLSNLDNLKEGNEKHHCDIKWTELISKGQYSRFAKSEAYKLFL
jgi:hypothetical protein